MGDFQFIETKIKDLYIIEPKCFQDDRGYFMEYYNKRDFEKAGLSMNFVQDNESKSKQGVLRGIHFQIKYPQGKLVRCTKGEVFDVAVDLREGSPTYGKWEGVILSEDNKRELGLAPEKEFTPEDIRGKFLEGTKHLKRRKESGRKPLHFGIIIVVIIILGYIWYCINNDTWLF